MRSFGLIPAFFAGLLKDYKPFGSARTSVGSYFDATGTLQTAPAYALRPNYVWNGTSWVRQGWLKEAAATNLLPYSSLDKDLVSLGNGGTVSATESPDGTLDALRVTQQDATATTLPLNVFAGGAISAPAGSTLSFFTRKYAGETSSSFTAIVAYLPSSSPKDGGQNINYDGSGFTGLWNPCTAYKATQEGPNWVRHSMKTPSAINVAKGDVLFKLGSSNDKHTDASFWGFQLEEATTSGQASSLIYTNGSPATRAAD